MKKIFFILLLLIGGVAMGQVWQPADPVGAMYSEPVTGTVILMSPTTLKVTTNASYTGVDVPIYLETHIYDSIGHFIERIAIPCNNTPPDICMKLYNHTMYTNGLFVFTIYGKMPYERNTMSYSISIFTYRAQLKYENTLKNILR